MKQRVHISGARATVLGGVGLLFAAWVVLHIGRLTGTQNGMIRFAMTTVFALLVLLRKKPTPGRAAAASPWAVGAAALVGVAGAVFGIVFSIHQVEWIGFLLLILACLAWALPARCSTDCVLALSLLYWAHPLPTQLFGPLKIQMQKMSVTGAEWLLHSLNVRVWADGMVLRTGPSIFEVPSFILASSGSTPIMR